MAKNADQQHVEELEQFLELHLPLPGCIKYRMEMEGKLDTSELGKHQKLLVGLRGFKTHFNQSYLSSTLLKVAITKESEWHLASEKPVYACETSKQLRAMLRDISQGLVKSKSKKGAKEPEWLAPFSGKEDHKDEEALHDQSDWLYKYDEVMRAAYRYSPGDADGNRSYCLKMDAPDGATEGDEIQASWHDGSTWRVPGMSIGDYKNFKQGSKAALPPLAGSAPGAKKGKATVSAEWQGPDQHGGLVMVKRSSAKGKEWAILWLSPKDGRRVQKCQVILNDLSPDDRQKAIDFAIDLGKTFAATTMDKADLEKQKKEFLANLASKGSAALRKRPAASSGSGSQVPAAPAPVRKRAKQEKEEEEEKADEEEDENEEEEEEEEDWRGFPEEEEEEEAEEEGDDEAWPSLRDSMPPSGGLFGSLFG